MPEVTEMLSLLAEQAEWRVFVDGTKNLGHQASTVMLLRRLIEATRFCGRVVVVYADHERALLGCTAEKLGLMFAGVDPRRLDDEVASHETCHEIRFLSLRRAGELHEPVAFGFTGGADDLTFNGAAALNVRFFLRLQPYLWDDLPSARRDPYYECSRIEQPDGRHFYPVEEWPELRSLAIRPPPSLGRGAGSASWEWYTRRQDFDPDLACRMRNARAIIDAARAGRGLLWPVYGLQHFHAAAPRIALSCVLVALRIAHQRRKSVLLCSFSPTRELAEWADLAEALSRDLALRQRTLPALGTALARRRAREIDGGDLHPHGPEHSLRALGQWLDDRCPGIGVAVHRASEGLGDWHDLTTSIAAALAHGGDPVVHLVELGPLAMDAFHDVIANADLPCVVEGQATANLLTTLGRPFLQLLRREHEGLHGRAAPMAFARGAAERMAAGARALRDLEPLCAGDSPSAYKPTAYGARLDCVAQLVDDAGDPSSTIGRHFGALAEYFARPPNDKLAIMLLALREMMLAA